MDLGEGGTPPIGSRLTELLAAIQRFAAGPESDQHPAVVGEEMIRLRRGIEQLELVFSRKAAGFAATDEWGNQGSLTPADWIRHQCKMTSSASYERLVLGEQVDRLPIAVAAMTEGRIGLGHIAHMARTARAMTGSKTEAFDERPLLAQAEDCSVGKFGHVCRHARHAQDPEGYAFDEAEAVERRELTLKPNQDDGMMYINGRLDAAGGALLRTALEPLARRSGPDDERGK